MAVIHLYHPVTSVFRGRPIRRAERNVNLLNIWLGRVQNLSIGVFVWDFGRIYD